MCDFWSCLLPFLTIVLLRANKAGWSLLVDDGPGRQEGSGFLSALPPAVSPVCPQGLTLKGRARSVRHWPSLDRVAVLWRGICPFFTTCLWSAAAHEATGTLTSPELWLLTQRKSLKLLFELVGFASAWQTDPRQVEVLVIFKLGFNPTLAPVAQYRQPCFWFFKKQRKPQWDHVWI